MKAPHMSRLDRTRRIGQTAKDQMENSPGRSGWCPRPDPALPIPASLASVAEKRATISYLERPLPPLKPLEMQPPPDPQNPLPGCSTDPALGGDDNRGGFAPVWIAHDERLMVVVANPLDNGERVPPISAPLLDCICQILGSASQIRMSAPELPICSPQPQHGSRTRITKIGRLISTIHGRQHEVCLRPRRQNTNEMRSAHAKVDWRDRDTQVRGDVLIRAARTLHSLREWVHLRIHGRSSCLLSDASPA